MHGSILDQKVDSYDGTSKNPIKERICNLKSNQLRQKYNQHTVFEKTRNAYYVRKIEIYCDSKQEQEAYANGPEGVDGIGRRLQIKYNNLDEVTSYTLDEGELDRGEICGFGRMVLCFG